MQKCNPLPPLPPPLPLSGSKCPTGEFLYTLNTEDNARVKGVFNDLSQHKPIFTDDRIGRRMTVDRRTKSPEAVTSYHRSDSRYSLQNQAPEYENRPTVQNLYENRHSLQNQIPEYENRPVMSETFVHNSADPVGISPPMGRRHSSVDGQSSTPNHHVLEPIRSNGSSRSIEDLTNRNYQNIVQSPHHGSGRRSPQKKTSAGTIPEQVPDGYYTVSPPLVLKKKKSSLLSSPPPVGSPSSPDEEEASKVPRPHRSTPSEGRDMDGEYVQLAGTAHMMMDTDKMVVMREGERGVNGRAFSPPSQAPPLPPHEPAVYQNLKFMKPSASNGVASEDGEKRRRYE